MATISLQKASDGTGVNIEERNIFLAYETASGSKIEFLNSQNGHRELVEVSNNIDQVAAVSEKLSEIILPDYATTTVYINSDRILNIYEDNAVANIIFDRSSSEKGKYVTTQTKEDVLTNVYTKLGYTVSAVESYAGATIVLPAASGDLTTSYVTGSIVTVYGALDENNTTYEVASVAFAVGQTTITLVAGVSDDTDTTGSVMVK